MGRLKKYRIIMLLGYGIIALSGCAALIEGARGVAGISTKELEKERKFALSKNFNYDYFSCYTKTLDTLKRIGAYVYRKDIKKRLIAVYLSEEDTTPVGVFFKEADANNTLVEVSSPSVSAKEFIAGRIFKSLSPEPPSENTPEENQEPQK